MALGLGLVKAAAMASDRQAPCGSPGPGSVLLMHKCQPSKFTAIRALTPTTPHLHALTHPGLDWDELEEQARAEDHEKSFSDEGEEEFARKRKATKGSGGGGGGKKARR